MTVEATAMKTIAGSAAADELEGGDLGYSFAESKSGDDDPPQHTVFLKHDGTTYVTNLAVNVQPFSGTYGGNYSANSDLAKLAGHGDAGYGLQCDFRWDGSPKFDVGQFTTFKTGTGVSFATRVEIPAASMSYNDSGTEEDASAPVAGRLGEMGNDTLGDRAHMTFRYKNPTGETQTGTRQFDIYWSFNFTN